MIDIGASLNLIAMSTLKAIGMVGKRILGVLVEITRFGGATKSTEGYVQLGLFRHRPSPMESPLIAPS